MNNSDIVYEADEVEWHPALSSSVVFWNSKGFHRATFYIEPPSCAQTRKGTYKVGIKRISKNEAEFFLKFPQSPVHTDPVEVVLSFQTRVYLCAYGEDSSKVLAMKQHVKKMAGKWSTYRQRIPWDAKFSDDLLCPGKDLIGLQNKEGHSNPVLIFELKSVVPIIAEDDGDLNDSEDLVSKAFSPQPKNKGVNMQGPTAQAQQIFEAMMAMKSQGIDIDQLLNSVSSSNKNAAATEIPNADDVTKMSVEEANELKRQKQW
jgi:hypothetical protein